MKPIALVLTAAGALSFAGCSKSGATPVPEEPSVNTLAKSEEKAAQPAAVDVEGAAKAVRELVSPTRNKKIDAALSSVAKACAVGRPSLSIVRATL